jgi:hypothetical protein
VFLKNAEASVGSKVYFVCITCREKNKERKRRAKSDLLGQPPLRRSRTTSSLIICVSLPSLSVINQI